MNVVGRCFPSCARAKLLSPLYQHCGEHRKSPARSIDSRVTVRLHALSCQLYCYNELMTSVAHAPAVLPVYPQYPTIIHALAKAAELRPDAPGVACQERELTYGAYAHAVAALAHEFARLGVAHERISFMMSNGLEACVGLLAGMAAGAQVSPLNPNFTDPELEPLLRDVEPRLLICDAGSSAKARALAQRLGIVQVVELGPGGISIDALLAMPQLALPLPRNEDLAALFFTGGTTGIPKGA